MGMVVANKKRSSDLETGLTQQINDMKAGLSGDASSRLAKEERLEQRFSELRAALDKQESSNKNALQELDRGLRAIGAAVDQEVRLRVEECSSAKAQILENAEGLTEKIRVLDDTVASEVRDQVKNREDILRQVREALSACEQERIDREEGDALLKMQMEGCKHEIACEKEERGDAMNSLSMEIRADTGKVKQQVDDINHVLDLEAAKRAAADAWNEKQHEAARADLEELKQAHAVTDDISKPMKQLRQVLEQESRTRAEGFSMMARELEALQGALDAEAAERAKGLLNIGDRLKSVSESVNLETKERSAAVETMTRLVVQAKEEVEKGAKERKIGEEDAERTKQELKQLIQLEKADRDREDNSLRMQMANVREVMSFEKECHSNAISSLRSALQLSDIKNEERHKGIQDDLRMEIEDRINSHEKFDKEGMDLRTGIAAD